MQKFSRDLEVSNGLNLIYSNGRGAVTRSKSHGGFDNDTQSMNSLLGRVLGEAPAKPFSEEDMKGY
jgi:hypothetical protein